MSIVSINIANVSKAEAEIVGEFIETPTYSEMWHMSYFKTVITDSDFVGIFDPNYITDLKDHFQWMVSDAGFGFNYFDNLKAMTMIKQHSLFGEAFVNATLEYSTYEHGCLNIINIPPAKLIFEKIGQLLFKLKCAGCTFNGTVEQYIPPNGEYCSNIFSKKKSQKYNNTNMIRDRFIITTDTVEECNYMLDVIYEALANKGCIVTGTDYKKTSTNITATIRFKKKFEKDYFQFIADQCIIAWKNRNILEEKKDEINLL